jgi:phage anti-repressor protein
MALSLIASFSAAQHDSLTALVRDKMSEESRSIFVQWFWPTAMPSACKYPISTRDAMMWLDFSKHSNFKRLVAKLLEADRDYEVVLPREQNPQGGRIAEQISLTVNGFKILAMNTTTTKGSQVRMYYLELEKIVQQFVSEEITKQIKFAAEAEIEKKNMEVRMLELEAQVAKKQKKKYEYGETVYIACGRYNDKIYHKVGSSINMNTRDKGYGSHTLDVKIIYTVRCHKRKVLEDLIHEVLRIHSIVDKPDCFDLPFEIVKEVMDACHVFIERTSRICNNVCDMDLAVQLSNLLRFNNDASGSSSTNHHNMDAIEDEADITAIEDEDDIDSQEAEEDTDEEDGDVDDHMSAGSSSDNVVIPEVASAQVGDIVVLPPINDITNFDKFIDECFIKTAGSSCTITNIQAMYRIWAKSTAVRSAPLVAYLEANGYKKVKVYDHIELTDNVSYTGLVMKPMPPLVIPAEPNEFYDFLLERCTIIVSGRVGSFEIKKAFQAWKREKMNNPTYKMSSADNTQLNAVFNKEFVYAVVATKERSQRGGWWGVCLKGDERVGIRKNVGNRKKFNVVDAKTNRVIAVYESATHAAHEMGIQGSVISIHKNKIYKGMRFVQVES